MRWKAKPVRDWKPWFALFPLKASDGQVVWLERIWVRFDPEWTTWARWEERPNDDPNM